MVEQNINAAPITNDKPFTAPNSDLDSGSWFEHKYIAATLHDNMWLGLAISFFVVILMIVLCVSCKRKRSRKLVRAQLEGYDETEIEYDTEDVEQQPFKYK
mmetsp:Transcript_11322/g.17189  ORF Transcript_11322/g.17189 Transcript_11322/m.17189 type:complete len:101 (+) Transcript_11322:130-432(+)|eukprot:CAMPEP_0202687208 /NCGR_PEP_ID=MMETSP1385-20130828/2915_1 /ASSEMBLY_ACC=CAM_ASM_000861 /TAXON_ID=933848 /ORGANISM="Elphidium margaritaceum" /LENGTH=100 /DNA_ID=CAMNT_0049341961 /DNA_START=116 /DNA_END=418 /DNA_ORIENTATION=+